MQSYDEIKNIKSANLKNKTVLIRLDLNVPIENGKVIDDYRIIKSLPSLKYLLKQKAKIRIITHLGRPKGKVVPELSTKILIEPLSTLLNTNIIFSEKYEPVDSDIVLYENLRFDDREELNDEGFAKTLSSLADVFVQDAFACLHRNHTSIDLLTKCFSEKYIGLLVSDEITNINKAVNNSDVAIVGGAKIETKLSLLKSLAKKMKYVLVGGKMANTLLYVSGNHNISDIEKNFIDECAKLINEHENIILPVDVVIEGGGNKKVTDILASDKIFDIGRQTINNYKEYIKKSEGVIWNGPLGMYENDLYGEGTKAICIELGKINNVIVGGGETVHAINKYYNIDSYDFISTGGGAFLCYIATANMCSLGSFS